jgi:hypothetical protein
MHGRQEWVWASQCQYLPTQADLMPPPDDGLNSYIEVGMTSIEAYGRGYVITDVQLLIGVKITETSCY